MDDEAGGILNIEISDTDDGCKKADRTGQTEAEFQAVKQAYRVKVENGELHKTINLSLDPAANKQRVQEVLHAVEELYFFRRYRDALNFIKTLQSDGSYRAIDGDARKQILIYEGKCQHKLNSPS
ncbi:hypothetical protein HRG_009422 [Hirsutella rhossiliensis]|uniref:Uncharacterized protein n=1 Tax=Hirsutella rhossiliensis TaxID=111463 RepID=A0A9P8MQZ8_9HYPO|nr:uncharacterized protein HRG_09422 [Hirsutella rhossiliensis]KAH0959640.1 hypothetical protein HRG_09422 [Hirsutella rhossiliensis]